MHALWGGKILGETSLVIGHRKALGRLMLIKYNESTQKYEYTLIDEGRGPANVNHYVDEDGKDVIIAANRETDEIAAYYFE